MHVGLVCRCMLVKLSCMATFFHGNMVVKELIAISSLVLVVRILAK